jgi:protein-L-isoaspartate O-methyltransferase
MKQWTNQAAIERWAAMPYEVLAETAEDGDFSKRHLVNPVLLRMLGEVAGRRVLDAGCGNGYFGRMLARAGARVTGVELRPRIRRRIRPTYQPSGHLVADATRGRRSPRQHFSWIRWPQNATNQDAG